MSDLHTKGGVHYKEGSEIVERARESGRIDRLYETFPVPTRQEVEDAFEGLEEQIALLEDAQHLRQETLDEPCTI